ncbi:ATP-binding protein [Plesiocystis pacifica]|uniref:ATP-binding protein n=1 Tax=Plesiocystis pacifica TaxID=191768 RepID=UPI0012FA7D1E|nr:ATP-binding protein [Plesiocystis pacifica]
MIAEDLPPLDVDALVGVIAEEAKAGARGPLRLAILGGAKPRRKRRKTAKLELTTDPLVANKWRNDDAAGDGARSIVVVLGPTAKLNSLRTALRPLRAKELRGEIARVASEWLEQPERGHFWRALAERSRDVPTATLLEYVAPLEASAKRPAKLLELEARGVWRMGLLRSPKLTSSAGLGSAKKALRANVDFVRSLETLSDKNLERLVHASDNGDKLTRQDADKLLRFAASRERPALEGISLERARELLRTELPQTAEAYDEDQPRPARKERVEGDILALDLLLSGSKGAKKAAAAYQKLLEPSPDGEDQDQLKLGERVVLPQRREGSRQSVGLFGGLLTHDVWGGIAVATDAVDFVSATKMIAAGDANVHPFTPGAEDHVRGMIEKAVNRRMIEPAALEAFDEYAERRATLLSSQLALLDHPLLALAADKKLCAEVGLMLDAYGRALKLVKEAADILQRRGNLEPARRLIARMLSLDIAFVRAGKAWFAVAAPTHPFHLWRLHALIEVFADDLDELRKIGPEELEDLVTDPHTATPHVVLSRFAADGGAIEHTSTLIAAGSYGALPMFAEPKARQRGTFKSKALAALADRLMRLMPHAAIGLRVTLVDPPSVAGALDRLLNLKNPLDDELPVPLHATVLRTRQAPDATDEEDDKLGTLARELVDAGGTLQVYPAVPSLADVEAHLRDRPAHLLALFDPGQAEVVKLSAPRPRLSPLTLPRSYFYDDFDDRIDVIVSGDIPLFGSYHELFCRTIDAPTSDILGRRSGASQSRKELERITNSAVWVSVLDQGIEPTFRIKGAERLDWRQDGGRDVVTVTAHHETVEHLVHDALRLAGLPTTEQSVKRTLKELFNLSGEAVLGLLRAQIGVSLVEPRFAKGLIGTLIAARWYLRAHPEALLISLDEKTSRRWILGVASDDRHGDLLGVRMSDAGPVLEAIEVKTYEDADAVVKVRAKGIEGEAVTQVDQTIAVLRHIIGLDDDGTAVARARESILKDQLYRAVAARPYSADRRSRLVRTLEELFKTGPAELLGLIFSVKIAPGEVSVSPDAPKYRRSPGKNTVGYVEIIEAGELPKRSRPKSTKLKTDASGPEPGSSPGSSAKSKSKSKKRSSQRKRSSAVQPDEDIRVHIGESPTGGEVTWAPHDEEHPLNNFGLLVTGDSGAGKTQILRAIIHAVTQAGVPVCAFDYKNDYADPEFSELVGLDVYNVDRQGLPFNPLELAGDETGRAQPIRHIHEIAQILKRVFSLGDQMEARLRKAMQRAYEARGIKARVWIDVDDAPAPPSFDEVIEQLESTGKNEKLLNRLSPLFDLGLFPSSEDAESTFDELLERSVALQLNGLPHDNIKQALSEFIIVRLHAHALRGEQPRRLRRLLVFDEAWRVKESTRLHQLAREGRAFGIGIALGTQFPGDIPDNLSGNLATQLFLQNQNSEHVKSVVRTLLGARSGRGVRSLETQIKQLQKYEGFFRNQQYTPYTFVTTLPHFKRV